MIRSAARLCLFIRTFIHHTTSMTFDFHKSDWTSPLPQFCQKRKNDVKVHYFFRIRVEIMPTPLAQNVEKAQTVNKDQNGSMTAWTSSDITQEFEETSCLSAD
jgi:hypothetical protein